jgi:hypothetical protein
MVRVVAWRRPRLRLVRCGIGRLCGLRSSWSTPLRAFGAVPLFDDRVGLLGDRGPRTGPPDSASRSARDLASPRTQGFVGQVEAVQADLVQAQPFGTERSGSARTRRSPCPEGPAIPTPGRRIPLGDIALSHLTGHPASVRNPCSFHRSTMHPLPHPGQRVTRGRAQRFAVTLHQTGRRFRPLLLGLAGQVSGSDRGPASRTAAGRRCIRSRARAWWRTCA